MTEDTSQISNPVPQPVSNVSWKDLLKLPILVSFPLTLVYLVYEAFLVPNAFFKLSDVPSFIVTSFPVILVITYCLTTAVRLLKQNIQFEESLLLIKKSYIFLIFVEVITTLVLGTGLMYSILFLTGNITLKSASGLEGLAAALIIFFFVASLIVTITTVFAYREVKKQSKTGYYLTWIVSLLLAGTVFLGFNWLGLFYGAFLVPFFIFLFKFSKDYTKGTRSTSSN